MHTTYTRQREAIIEYFRGSHLHLSDDGCYDNPGYSAKYCKYTLTDTSMDLILDYSLLHCTDTGSLIAIEKEGL